MRKIFMNIIIIAASVSLVACSTNTQKQNEVAGTATGAVLGGVAGSFIGAGTGQLVAIGAGAVIGGLLGYEVGKNMDSSDNQATYNALNNNPKNKSARWKNKKTGGMYTMTPTSNRFAMGGYNDCRTFRTTALVNGQKQSATGTACRQSNGTWINIKS